MIIRKGLIRRCIFWAWGLRHSLGTFKNLDRNAVKLTGTLSQSDLSFINTLFKQARKCYISDENSFWMYSTYATQKTFDKLNKYHQYFDFSFCDEGVKKEAGKFFSRLINSQLSGNWAIVNIRGWDTIQMPGEEYGPNAFHTDGFPPGFLKLLIYPFGVGEEEGGVEWIEENNDLKRLKGGPGAWLLFSNSSIVHRGLAPKKGKRRMIEFTVCQTFLRKRSCIVGSPWDQFPIVPLA